MATEKTKDAVGISGQETRPVTTAKCKSARKTLAETAGVFCYVGPSISGVIQEGTVYAGTRNEIEQRLWAAIESFPGVKSMIVPGESLAKVRQGLKSKNKDSYSVTYTELCKRAAEKRAKEVGGNG